MHTANLGRVKTVISQNIRRIFGTDGDPEEWPGEINSYQPARSPSETAKPLFTNLILASENVY